MHPAEVILRQIKRLGAGLLAMGVYESPLLILEKDQDDAEKT